MAQRLGKHSPNLLKCVRLYKPVSHNFLCINGILTADDIVEVLKRVPEPAGNAHKELTSNCAKWLKCSDAA